MASVKLIFRKKANKEGKFPLALRITKDRKSSFIYPGHSIHEDEWDETQQHVKKTHPNSVRLNNFILKKLAEANDQTLELETQKKQCVFPCRQTKNQAVSRSDVQRII